MAIERVNIYGKERFLPREASVYVKNTIDQFKQFYTVLGYAEVPSVTITSGVDPTVRFIGSHISVMKPFLFNNNVPSPGLYIHQNCIRTRNVDKLLDDEFNPKWGSYFPSIGVLVPPERLKEGSLEAFTFLQNILNIPSSNLLVRISSIDQDLLSVAHVLVGQEKIEIDSRDPIYYRHKLGMPGIFGRNFNVALQRPDATGDFFDIGNVILIENENKPLGVEIALGTTTILKELYGLEHVQDCIPVEGLEIGDEALRRKMEDAIIVSCTLFNEGLRPSEQHNRNRLLKKYIQAMSYFRAKLRLTHQQLGRIITNFAITQLNIQENISENIISSVVEYEDGLESKQNLAKDDEKVIKALNTFS